MAITSTGLNAATVDKLKQTTKTEPQKDKTKLDKDDFLKLLLVELQHQDPTEPMDSDKILNQTSQLSSLEASTNTTKALQQLSESMKSSNNFSSISAIGKMADLGSDTIAHDEGKDSDFELYFQDDVKSGEIDIKDSDGNVVSTIKIPNEQNETIKANNVYKFTWDGLDSAGNDITSGVYHIEATYKNNNGEDVTSKLGLYPIESIRFDDGKALAKFYYL